MLIRPERSSEDVQRRLPAASHSFADARQTFMHPVLRLGDILAGCRTQARAPRRRISDYRSGPTRMQGTIEAPQRDEAPDPLGAGFSDEATEHT